MTKFDPDKDYYKVLGVSRDATQEDIDRAYRLEARQRHPDSGGSEEDMKSLNEARDVLSDPQTRNEYDQARLPPRVEYSASMAFDAEAASQQGTLKIPVSSGDLAGLVISAAACLGVGFPLLALVETQWVFFLWPLRLMALGALVVGSFMAHSAMSLKHRQMIEDDPNRSRARFVFDEIAFWIFFLAVIAAAALLIYFT
ncbi:MAG: DnaJ domain-containing protein [Acidobacteriota bacterium]